MALQFILCQTDADWEAYTFYILDHKLDIHPAFVAKKIIHFIKEQIFYGQAVIVKNDSQEVVAAFGFIYGTPENGFADKETVRIEMVHILPTYRHSRLFYNGLKWFKQYLNEHAPETKQIQFYTESSSESRTNLFKKIASLVSTEETLFGIEHEFVASKNDFNQW